MSLTLAETAELLALCAAFDRRTVGEADVWAWQSVLDCDLDTAKDAVRAHYARWTRFCMPADVNAHAKTFRAERRQRLENEARHAQRPMLALAPAPGRPGRRPIAEPSPWYVQARQTLAELRARREQTADDSAENSAG